jgi:hypothetical protein
LVLLKWVAYLLQLALLKWLANHLLFVLTPWCTLQSLTLWIPDVRMKPVTGRAVWCMNCLLPLQDWDRRFKFHWRHGCLCAFILCLFVLCVGRGLAMGWF